MRENQFKDIHTLLNSMLQNFGIKNYVSNERLIQNWNNVVGNRLGNQCYPVKIQNGVLFLKVKNSVWRNELALRQMELIELITKNYDKNTIKKIQFI